MTDIAGGVLTTQRAEVKIHQHALGELGQLGTSQGCPQSGLPHQDHLQHLVLVGVDVGQHAQFFQGVDAQILGLVDDEHGATATAILLNEEIDEALMLLHRASPAPQLEGQENPVHEVAEAVEGIGYQPHAEFAARQGEQLADQGGLAGADLAADDTEPGLVVQAQFQQPQGLFMLGAEVEIIGIRQQGKRLFPETIECIVHA